MADNQGLLELSDEQRAELLRLAAQRGLKGFSPLIQEALDHFLRDEVARKSLVEAALKTRGSLSESDADDLEQTAKTLEDNLHKKEGYVKAVIDNKASFNKLKTLPADPKASLAAIQHFTTNHNIWFILLNNDTLSFWSGIKVIPKKHTHTQTFYA